MDFISSKYKFSNLSFPPRARARARKCSRSKCHEAKARNPFVAYFYQCVYTHAGDTSSNITRSSLRAGLNRKPIKQITDQRQTISADLTYRDINITPNQEPYSTQARLRGFGSCLFRHNDTAPELPPMNSASRRLRETVKRARTSSCAFLFADTRVGKLISLTFKRRCRAARYRW